MIAILVLAATAPLSVGSSAPPEGVRTAEVDRYFSCIANLSRASMFAVLVATKRRNKSALERVQVVDCYDPAWTTRKVSLGNYFFAGKLAEALIRQEPTALTDEDVGGVGDLPIPPFMDDNDPLDKEAESFRVIVDCAVKQQPAVGRHIVMSDQPAAEAATIRTLSLTKSCPDAELIATVDPLSVRAAVALSYYRLGSLARKHSVGSK